MPLHDWPSASAADAGAAAAVPVSVVIPVHNGESFFDEALASVRAQSAAPCEVIVVDDGSDASGRRFLDDRRDGIILIRLPERRGPGPARNAGVAAATQPYVAFLDADDRWMPSKLRVQYAVMRARPELDATFTASVVSHCAGRVRARVDRPRVMTVRAALNAHEMPTPSTMMRRESFLRLGGFDRRFRCTQDWELQIRMALAGYRIQYIPLPLVWVRRENHGHHSGHWRCYLAGHLKILLKHRGAYVEQWGYPGWIHLFARELARAGIKRGGWLGLGMRLPARLGV